MCPTDDVPGANGIVVDGNGQANGHTSANGVSDGTSSLCTLRPLPFLRQGCEATFKRLSGSRGPPTAGLLRCQF